MVLDSGFVLLAQAFRSAFPRLTYHHHCANAVEEAKAIQSAFESLVCVKESATLALFGIDFTADADSSSTSSLNDVDADAGYDTLTPHVFS